VSFILNAHPAADGSRQRHHRRRSSVNQAFCENHIIGGIGQNSEPFLYRTRVASSVACTSGYSVA